METFQDKVESIFKNFSKLNSFSEKLDVFLQCAEVREFVRENLKINSCEKSPLESAKHRNLGNDLFKRKEDDLALQEYNIAVNLGSHLDQTLRRGEYKKTIQDIDLALVYGYPSNLIYKVLERRARACIALGDRTGALEDLIKARDSINQSQQECATKTSSLQTIESLIKEVKLKKNSSPAQPPQPVQPARRKHPKFAGFNDIVQVQFLPGSGRFMVADRDIQVGELIGTERPAGSVVLNDSVSEKCDSCLTDCLLAPIPCTSCITARYCSVDCRTQSMESHMLECGVHETISRVVLENQILPSFPQYYRLGFRILARARRCSQVLETIQTFLDEESLDFSRSVEQQEMDFLSVLNLCGWDANVSLEKDFWTFIMVLLYLEVFDEKDFYMLSGDSQEIWGLTDNLGRNINKLKTGELLFRIVKIVQYNCHSVMQCVHDQAGSEFRMESIGSALYTSLAFLNHSCDPNTIKYFVGNTVFLVASRPILQGEEVTDNYGPHFSLSTRISRHNWLQEYHGFICSCTACTLNYPLAEHLPRTITRCVCSCRSLRHEENQKGKGSLKGEGGLKGELVLKGDTWICSCGKKVSKQSLENQVKCIMQRLIETAKVEFTGVEEGRVVSEYIYPVISLD
ncbi:SET and MYND domain-containing protein 4 isoform X2 [Eurytemora carolleeae]|uniref:SET and MYND domain-containing protein 4 isoform X2 n=1 Tax=Eurytemora carolleeae TaxID=1294199 RepID=UPI000C78AD27|nr:SET and MYND domain-containing protein 4 isoform X2 [Eurytemora carolleeae]|eukprot:XP_023326763.1 SET and MYND domain-containing protein 4-like isoform X2 [Eurytemora affinis]